MSFELNEDVRAAVDGLRRYLDKEVEPVVAEYRDKFIPTDRMKEIQKELMQFGLTVAPQSEEIGGFGLDWAAHLHLVEEVSYTSADLAFPIFINTVSIHGMSNLGSANSEIVDRYLPGLMNGDLIACSGVSEPNTGSDVSSMTMRAKKDGDHYVISGEKMWVTNGVYSDFCILMCLIGEGAETAVGQIVVDKFDHGYEAKNISKIGLKSQSTTQIHFDEIRVPTNRAIVLDGSGLKAALIGFEIGRLHMAAISCGIARRALDEAVRYSQDRVQHGKAIAGHQLIAGKLAEMATEIDASRLLTMRAAELLDQGKRCDKEVSMAKWYANEVAVRVTREAMAIHGANGLTTEFLVEKLARDALVCTIPDGTPEIQKLIIARRLTGVDAFR